RIHHDRHRAQPQQRQHQHPELHARIDEQNGPHAGPYPAERQRGDRLLHGPGHLRVAGRARRPPADLAGEDVRLVGGPALGPGDQFAHRHPVHHRTTTVPALNPLASPTSATRSPRRTRPAATAWASWAGSVAATRLPCWAMVTTTLSCGIPTWPQNLHSAGSDA